MRQHGGPASVAGMGVHDHACLPYLDDGEARSAAVQYLTDGRRLGQRLFCAGRGSEEELREHLRDLEDLDALVRVGTLELSSMSEAYGDDGPFDPEAQLSFYVEATERALADGYTGLRVVGDATEYVRDPEGWVAFARYEALVERFMAARPMAGLCRYDAREVDPDVVAALLAIHPMQCGRGKVSPFQLYALDEDALALSGEVDRFSAAALERVLTIGTDHSTNTILDLTQLNFMDHHGLQALAEVAGRWEEGDAKLSVRNAPPIVRRMSELLEIDL